MFTHLFSQSFASFREGRALAARSLLFTLLGTAISGCAGPTTPLGAVALQSVFRVGLSPSTQDQNDGQGSREGQILFDPPQMNFHESRPLLISIVDPKKVKPGYRFKLLYNTYDVTSSFLKMAQYQIAAERERLKITIPNLQLQGSQDHSIEAHYKGTTGTQLVKKWQSPICNPQALHPSFMGDTSPEIVWWSTPEREKRIKFFYGEDWTQAKNRLVIYSHFHPGGPEAIEKIFNQRDLDWDKSGSIGTSLKAKTEKTISHCSEVQGRSA